jgi:hypothetical protein
MLLMDRVAQLTATTRRLTNLRTTHPIEEAVRFRLDEKAQAFIDAIALDPDRLIKAAPCLFWPGSHIWLEWRSHGHAFGVRFVGSSDDELHVGTMNLWMWPHDRAMPILGLAKCDLQRKVTPIEIMMVTDDVSVASLSKIKSQTLAWLGSDAEPKRADDQRATAATILGILSFLNSPRLVRLVDISRTRLNAARSRRGKYPLLAYREVSVDLGEDAITALRLDSDGTRRALHWVRAHLRFRLGQWEIVKPHWRGDASLGVRRPAYRLTKKD